MLRPDEGIKALSMSVSVHPPEHWTPTSAEDRELVQKELDSILASYHFRGSKRYPAMLKYVVGAALEGHAGDLKERTLGVEVFGRDPDYDTSADPVVRFSASEVRKRIAQYYHENGSNSQLQIEMPLGSYVPEFLLRGEGAPDEHSMLEYGRWPALGRQLGLRRRSARVAVVILSMLMLAVGGIYAYLRLTAPKPSASDKLWAPLVKPVGPILIVVGTSHNGSKPVQEAADTSFLDHMTGPYHHVSVAIATAIANVAGVLRQDGKNYEIKEDIETSLTDVHCADADPGGRHEQCVDDAAGGTAALSFQARSAGADSGRQESAEYGLDDRFLATVCLSGCGLRDCGALPRSNNGGSCDGDSGDRTLWNGSSERVCLYAEVS